MSVAERLSEYRVTKRNEIASFLNEFEDFVESPESLVKFRSMVFDLAIRGKLVEQRAQEGNAQALIGSIADDRKNRSLTKSKLAEVEPSSCLNLPVTWKKTTLGYLSLQIHYGYTASADHELRDVRMLRITDIQNGRVNWDTVPGCVIEPEKVDQYRLHDNDILIARTGGTIGKTFLIRDVSATSVFASYLIRVIPSQLISAEYLKLYFESSFYWGQLLDRSAGTGQPNVNATSLRTLVIPLPPLAEQHRIVAKVGGLMRLCDELEAKQAESAKLTERSRRSVLASLTSSRDARELSTAWRRFSDHFEILLDRPETLADLRQTILALAVQGKLVKQDPKDEPADALFAKIMQTKKSLVDKGEIKPPKCPRPNVEKPPFAVAASWMWVKLGAIAHTIESGWSPKCESHPREGDEWGVLKISAVTWGDFQPEENKALPAGVEPRPYCEVQRGDFLMSRANTAELVAKSVVVRETPSRLMMNDKLLRVVFSPHISLEYVNLVNNSAQSRTYYECVASGTSVSMRNVSRENVTNLPMPLPPLAEQERIVAKVDRLLAQCDRVAAKLHERQTTIEQLLTASIHRLLLEEVC